MYRTIAAECTLRRGGQIQQALCTDRTPGRRSKVLTRDHFYPLTLPVEGLSPTSGPGFCLEITSIPTASQSAPLPHSPSIPRRGAQSHTKPASLIGPGKKRNR